MLMILKFIFLIWNSTLNSRLIFLNASLTTCLRAMWSKQNSLASPVQKQNKTIYDPQFSLPSSLAVVSQKILPTLILKAGIKFKIFSNQNDMDFKHSVQMLG